MKIPDTRTLATALVVGGAGVLFWLWWRGRSGADPQELPDAPEQPLVSLSNVGPDFIEDDPTDEVVSTLLSADISRRPYSIKYDQGATSLYLRFVDDYTNVKELGAAELQAWLNDKKRVQMP